MRNAIYSCFVAVGALIAILGAVPVQAATCGGTYTVQSGDTLWRIAGALYNDPTKWKALQADNLTAIGGSTKGLQVGMRLSVACIDGLPTGLEGGADLPETAEQTGTTAPQAKINLMTASDYAPFSDRDLPNGGLMTDVVSAAMAHANPVGGFEIHWVERRETFLDPQLSDELLDMGFPWSQPDCVAAPEDYICANFLFSDMMFEMLTGLFTATDAPVVFDKDTDLHGKTLCRPSGYALHQLDRPDRRWLSDGLIELKRPHAVADCFAMLMAGEVDAVVLNEFTGRAAISDLGLTGKVDLAPRPLAIEGLHLLIHKTHPQARAMLEIINGGLRGINDNGSFQRIVDTHLTRIWAEY